MAVESTLQKFSMFAAGADLTAAQFRFVKISAGTIVLCGAGEQAAGVLQNAPKQGEAAIVGFSGISKVMVGGTDVAQDAEVATLANGLAGTAASGNAILGQMTEGGTKSTLGTLFLQFQGAKA